MACANCHKISSEPKTLIYQIWEAEFDSLPRDLRAALDSIALRRWTNEGLVGFEVPRAVKGMGPYLAVA